MKLQFKHQKFQADAAKAVVDVFAGQPYLTPSYMILLSAIKKSMMSSGLSKRRTVLEATALIFRRKWRARRLPG